jgi:hypothetical protein
MELKQEVDLLVVEFVWLWDTGVGGSDRHHLTRIRYLKVFCVFARMVDVRPEVAPGCMLVTVVSIYHPENRTQDFLCLTSLHVIDSEGEGTAGHPMGFRISCFRTCSANGQRLPNIAGTQRWRRT